MRLKQSLRKILAAIATFATLANSLLTPAAVLAQEATPAPTPDSTQLSASPTAQPTETATSTPEATVTPSETQTPTPAATPTVTSTPEGTPTTTDPPAENNPTATPTATPDTSTETGTLTTTTINNVDLSNVTGLNSNVDGSASISTDQADYSPTSVVLITGSGFIANKTYTIEIVSTDQPPVDFSDNLKSDSSGNLSYAYQLDGNYRPNYTAYVKDGEVVVASTSFTDGQTVTILGAGTGDGAVSSSQGGLSCDISSGVASGSNCSKSLNQSSVTLTANASPGSIFSGWNGGNCTGTTNPCIFTLSSNVTITATFDLSSSTPTPTPTGNIAANLEQCHNGDGHGNFVDCTDPSPSGNTWGSGNAGQNNASLYEGDSQNYRLILTGVTSGSPITVGISQQYTKGGKMAYDFPTGPGNLGTATTPIGLDGIFPCDDNGSQYITPCDHSVPSTTTAGKLLISAIPGGVIPDTTVSGETVSAQSTYYGVSESTSPTRSPQYLYVYGATPGSFGGYTFSGDAAHVAMGDTNLNWTFTITPTNDTVVIAWGAHISKSGDYGTKGTAVTINGSPYHTILDSVTGTNVGNQDMQMAAGAIVSSSSITVNKVLSPTNDTGLFNLQIDGTTEGTGADVGNGGTTGQFIVSSSDTHTVGETAGTSTTLSDYSSTYSCVDGQTTVTSGSGTTSPSFSVAAGHNVVCTFTNTRNTGSIELKKSWSGTPGQTTLDIGTTAGASDVASQQTGINGGAPLTTGSQTVDPGTYYVSETGGLSDYTSSLACTDDGNSVTPGVDNSLSVASNHTVVCTFTNTRNTGSIKVNKLADTDGNGTFETTNPANFTWSLDGSGTNTMGSTVSGIDTGSHDVNENSVSNYHFVGWYDNSGNGTCDNPDGTTLPVSVSVSKGATSEITLCNAHDTGTIVVHKDVQGPSGEDITDTTNNFSVQIDGSDTRTITDNGTVTYSNVLTGSNHTITESVIPSGYSLYGISLTAGNSGSLTGLSVSVTSGQTTDVYVTNRQQSGKITVVKYMEDPDGNPVSDYHSFTTNLSPGNQSSSFALGTNAEFTVNPGKYTVTESPDSNYTELGCVLDPTGGDATDFSVLPGGNVTVDCTNQQKPATIIVEKTVVASDGTTIVLDGHTFHVTVDGTQKDLISGTDTTFTVNPGTYSATESAETNYDEIANDSSKTVGSNGTATIHITNEQHPGSISGTKYDNLGNVLSGWTIKLFSCTANFASCDATASAQQATDQNGFYSFTNLISGYYQVVEQMQNGWTNLTDLFHNITIGAGTDSTDNNFTNVKYGYMQGRKYSDANINGVLDQGESFLDNWTIRLYDDSWNLLGTQTTGSPNQQGQYNFGNLLPGTYYICEVQQNGWQQTGPLVGSHPVDYNSSQVNGSSAVNDLSGANDEAPTCWQSVVTSGEELGWLGFGNVQEGSITINKTTDPTSSQQTFEFNLAGAATGSAILGNGGSKTFDSLLPGDYTITETEPSGWDLTNLTCDNNISIRNGGTISLTAGENVNCTFTNTEYGSIQGRKFNDVNGNGVFDNSEKNNTNRLNGWTITLYDSAWNVLGSMLTGSNNLAKGQYRFGDLLPGTYYVCETLSDHTGWIQTYPSSGEIKDGTFCNTVNLSAGQNEGYVHFGNFQLGKVSGYKWDDANGNGSWDNGELPLENWTIYLGKDSTTTDSNGYYEFDNLTAGDYALSENLETGYQQTGAPSSSVTVTSGTNLTHQDFFNQGIGTVTVTKFNDENDNSTYDQGESVLSGWTINLEGQTSQVTDNNGQVVFTNVPEGSHLLGEEFPKNSNWIQTTIYCDYGQQNILSLISQSSDSVNVTPGSDISCYIGNFLPDPNISITKSNDKGSGASAGDTVTYTLTVTNTGNTDLDSVEVKDILPGGFTYVTGSTTGDITTDPTISGNTLTWSYSGTLGEGDSITVEYQAKIASDATQGSTYTNYATCDSFYENGEQDVPCGLVSSNVTIGSGTSYGGNLVGQVLGISTELPGTGSPTLLLLAALTLLGTGLILNGIRKRKEETHAKN